jgi:cobalt-zinc-cadmium efflux system membrane fusion protein
MFWKSVLALATLAGVGGAAYVAFGGANHKNAPPGSIVAGISVRIQDFFKHLGQSEHEAPPAAAAPGAKTTPASPRPRWDGLVTIDPAEREAIGLRTVTVQAQSDPIKLELTGRTGYDPDTLTKIRPRFDTFVQKVHVGPGQRVKKGDPLVELFSTDLAQAKSDFQKAWVQWQHDLTLYNIRHTLMTNKSISIQQFADIQNDERKSRLEVTLARDKLGVLGVPIDEIDHLVANLGSEIEDPRRFGSLEDKAKMTMRAPVNGIVIKRDVVPQNLYHEGDILLEIAPLDHLWVWVNVYEVDQDKVRRGQTLEIQFPYLDEKVEGTVQYIATEVSKETRAVQVRATILNPGARLKSDMLVKAILDIPPLPGQTNVPRMAVVTSNSDEYVFVRLPRSGPGPDKFQRKKVEVSQENSDTVVVAKGLKEGEEAVTNGSLILEQMYEDLKTVDSGTPLDSGTSLASEPLVQ